MCFYSLSIKSGPLTSLREKLIIFISNVVDLSGHVGHSMKLIKCLG